MPTLLRQPLLRTALIAASMALPGLHASAFASPDAQFVIETCPKKGRDPFASIYTHSCGVWRPDDLVSPSWNTLEVMAIDAGLTGGNVVATLQCMSRQSGAVSAVATVKSVRSTTAKSSAARLPAPLNFKLCAYFLNISVNGTSAPAQALMVSLRT